MHLLFYGGEQRKVLHSKSVEAVLRDLSVRVSTSPYGPYQSLHALDAAREDLRCA